MKIDPGLINWIDISVPDAVRVKDFYQKVTGWQPHPVNMGDYDDFTMIVPGSDQPAAGICHARGTNIDMPGQWLIYINVQNLDDSIKACQDNGGEIIRQPRTMSGYGRFAVIKDPAGAVAALFEPE